MTGKRTLQEVADFFGCEVELNPYGGTAALWKKNEEGVMVCIGELVLEHMLQENENQEEFVYVPTEGGLVND